jgi:hypothetical protein
MELSQVRVPGDILGKQCWVGDGHKKQSSFLERGRFGIDLLRNLTAWAIKGTVVSGYALCDKE